MRYIDENELKEIFIIKKVVHLDKYDMCYIKLKLKDNTERVVRVFCDKDTFPDFDSEEFKKMEKMWLGYSKRLSMFLGGRLFGADGLMNEQGRDDYIYLGGYFNRKMEDDRYEYDKAQGKTKQQIFDENLFRIKMQVAAKEQPVEEKRETEKGKHYAISDIHGMYGSYDEAMKRMSLNDHLYIIGDVIDRGSEGIRILQDIIRRKNDPHNNPEITFLLGNHEWQFLHCLALMQHFDLTEQEVDALAMEKHLRKTCSGDLLKQEMRKYASNCLSAAKKGITDQDVSWFYAWYLRNHGEKTLQDFLKLDEKQQEEIEEFLSNSPLALPQEIGGKKYLFVHSKPPEREELLQSLLNGNEVNIDNIDQRTLNNDAHTMLEGREKKIGTYTYGLAKRYGFTTICGHEPRIGEIVRNLDKGFVRIDAGCPSWGKLALYCIDDGTVEYIDEKETSQEL